MNREIKYHLNGTGQEYGPDHQLTNNWNPAEDYGNEYVNVYFRIECPTYQPPSFIFKKEDKISFYAEVHAVLLREGWEISTENKEELSMTVRKGKQHLYLHPQNISGEILKNEVKQLAEAFKENTTFSLRWVDLYQTVYDISDTEYDIFLTGQKAKIEELLTKYCKTTRTNKFISSYEVCRKIADSVRLCRVGLNDGKNYGTGQTISFINSVIIQMIADGNLKEAIINERRYIRSLNVTEQKKLKKKVA